MLCSVIMVICLLNGYSVAEEVTTEKDVKVFVDHSSNIITQRPHRVKPTSAVVQHEPGVPPGWGDKPSRPNNKPSRPGNLSNRPTYFPSRPGFFKTSDPENNLLGDQSKEEYSNSNFTYNNLDDESANSDFTNEISNSSFSDEISNSTFSDESSNSSITDESFNSTFTTEDSSSFDIISSLHNLNGTGLNFTEILTEVDFNVTDLFNLTDSNVTRPPLGQPEAVFVAGDPDRGNFLDWVLTSLGIGGSKPDPEVPNISEPPSKTCKPCTCGKTYKHNRIVGGIVTKVNYYPWMVYLTYKNRFYCGATLISNNYVMTAGHCVSSFPKQSIGVVFLDHDRSVSDSKIFTRKVNAVLKHKNYNLGGSYNNDIALLRLDSPVGFDGILQPVCLPPLGKPFNGETGIVVGWGALKEGGAVSNKLMEVEVPILSNEECRESRYGNKITDNMMCAGYVNMGQKDSCQGDSGGPLHVIRDEKHIIAGIVSWGEGCAQAHYPGVYTRVNRYISWIKANTKDSCYCDALK